MHNFFFNHPISGYVYPLAAPRVVSIPHLKCYYLRWPAPLPHSLSITLVSSAATSKFQPYELNRSLHISGPTTHIAPFWLPTIPLTGSPDVHPTKVASLHFTLDLLRTALAMQQPFCAPLPFSAAEQCQSCRGLPPAAAPLCAASFPSQERVSREQRASTAPLRSWPPEFSR